eukprot:c20628_g1_i1 orf=251-559(+)
MHLNLEFGGGLELLFGSVKTHRVEFCQHDGTDENQEIKMDVLLVWIRDNLLKERPEMFMKDKSVRPGVLVLINDCDWELCGRLEATLQDNDTIVFISTLHGG